MVDSIRSHALAAQLQTTASPDSARRLHAEPTPKEKDDRTSVSDGDSDDTAVSAQKSAAQARAANDATQKSSEDLRERARQLIEARNAGGSNANSGSIRRGSVLDITA